jgi:methionyl-tRNA formyltransferase
VAAALVSSLRELGHDPVAVVSARRRQPVPGREPMGDETAPEGLDVLLARDKWSVEPLLRASRPDLVLCWGFPWRIPQAALDVPPLGSINCHPAMLPRHRGPIPLAWAFRDGDRQFGVTWHRMDAELDTGPILAQAPVPMLDDDFGIEVVGPRMGAIAIGLLPEVLSRVAAGDPGDEQSTEGVTWAGHFGDDYASVDWSQPARRIHDQVRAWAFTFGLSPIVGPITELDGQRVRLIRTSLTDPGGDARRVETGDGPLWVVATEPAEA